MTTKIPSTRLQFPQAIQTHRAAEQALAKVVERVEKDSFVGWVATRDEQPRLYRPGGNRMPAFFAGIAAAFPSMKELRDAKALVESTKGEAFTALHNDLSHMKAVHEGEAPAPANHAEAKRELSEALNSVDGAMFIFSGHTMAQIQTRMLALSVAATLDG